MEQQPGLLEILAPEWTQAQYNLCSYAVPEDHPDLAVILLMLREAPEWQDLPLTPGLGTRIIA